MTLALDTAFVLALCLAPFVILGIFAEALIELNRRLHK